MGFEAVVRRGVFPNREEAKVAADTKTIRNIEDAIARGEDSGKASHDKRTLDVLTKSLKAANTRLVKAEKALAALEKG